MHMFLGELVLIRKFSLAFQDLAMLALFNGTFDMVSHSNLLSRLEHWKLKVQLLLG